MIFHNFFQLFIYFFDSCLLTLPANFSCLICFVSWFQLFVYFLTAVCLQVHLIFSKKRLFNNWSFGKTVHLEMRLFWATFKHCGSAENWLAFFALKQHGKCIFFAVVHPLLFFSFPRAILTLLSKVNLTSKYFCGFQKVLTDRCNSSLERKPHFTSSCTMSNNYEI